MRVHDTGWASGWATEPPQEDQRAWRWRAYGPAGSRAGAADDEADAVAAAVAALAELERPVERVA